MRVTAENGSKVPHDASWSAVQRKAMFPEPVTDDQRSKGSGRAHTSDFLQSGKWQLSGRELSVLRRPC